MSEHNMDSNPQQTEQVPTIEVKVRQRSGLGLVSLILGIVAFLICWIPLVGALGIPLSAVGAVLGLIAVTLAARRSGAGIGFAIGGTVASAVALWVAISMTGAIFKSFEDLRSFMATNNETNQQTVGAETTPGSAGGAAEIANPEWAPADKPVMQDDVQVQITSAHVHRVRYEGKATLTEKPLLEIHLVVTNTGKNRKVEYLTWGGHTLSTGDATVTDNFGNEYDTIRLRYGDTLESRTHYSAIYPGESITDALLFERPLKTVEYLNLELDGENFGSTGKLRFRIPLEMLQRKE